MRRRDVLALVGGVTALCPLAAGGQQKAMPVIGFLSSGSEAAFRPFVAAFRQGLKEVATLKGRQAIDDDNMLTMEYADLVLPLLDGIAQTLALLCRAVTRATCGLG